MITEHLTTNQINTLLKSYQIKDFKRLKTLIMEYKMMVDCSHCILSNYDVAIWMEHLKNGFKPTQ